MGGHTLLEGIGDGLGGVAGGTGGGKKGDLKLLCKMNKIFLNKELKNLTYIFISK